MPLLRRQPLGLPNTHSPRLQRQHLRRRNQLAILVPRAANILYDFVGHPLVLHHTLAALGALLVDFSNAILRHGAADAGIVDVLRRLEHAGDVALLLDPFSRRVGAVVELLHFNLFFARPVDRNVRADNVAGVFGEVGCRFAVRVGGPFVHGADDDVFVYYVAGGWRGVVVVPAFAGGVRVVIGDGDLGDESDGFERKGKAGRDKRTVAHLRRRVDWGNHVDLRVVSDVGFWVCFIHFRAVNSGHIPYSDSAA